MLYARDFRKQAYNALGGIWGLAVGTGFVAALLGGTGGNSIPDFNTKYSNDSYFKTEFIPIYLGIAAIALIYALVIFFFGGAVSLGYCRFNKNVIQRNNPQFSDLFSNFHIFWKAFLLQLLMGIFIFLWTLLLIIPGIIAAYSYSMAPYIMDDNPELSALEAIGRSREMMRGNKWRLFCLQISFIGWAILCLFTCCIGFLWLNPYYYAAEAAFYLDLKGNNMNNNQQYYNNGYNNNGYNNNNYTNNGYNNNDYNNNNTNNGYNNTNYNNYNNNSYNGNNTNNGYNNTNYNNNSYNNVDNSNNGYNNNGVDNSGYYDGNNNPQNNNTGNNANFNNPENNNPGL